MFVEGESVAVESAAVVAGKVDGKIAAGTLAVEADNESRAAEVEKEVERLGNSNLNRVLFKTGI